MRHTHLGQPVRFPKGAHPGDRIKWTDTDAAWSDVQDGRAFRCRMGTVLDRAANGVGDGCEAPGFWLWVQADDGTTVRVRYIASGKREGQAWRDDGPQWVRSGLGYDEVWTDGHRYPAHDWRMAKRTGRCLCCAQEARTG